MAKTEAPALADTGNCHRDLVNTAADFLWECNEAGRVTAISPEFEDSTGLSARTLLGGRLTDLLATRIGMPEQPEQIAAIGAAKPFRDLVLGLRDAAGRIAWLEMVGTPIFEFGRFRGYTGFGKTVTERIEAAASLGDSERHYRQLFEVAGEWFWETDAQGRFTFLSLNIEKVLGRPISAYIGKRLAETEGVVIETEAGRACLDAIKAQLPYREFLYSRTLPSGRVVWINSSGAPFRDADGVFLGYRGIARDVTAQIDAERRLRDGERQFRQLLETYSDYSWEQDEQHRVTSMRPESTVGEIYGFPAAEFLGKRFSEMMTVSCEPEMGRRFLLATKARQPFRDVIVSVQHPTGRTRWVSICGAPRFDDDGEFCGFRGVGVEITGRVEAEAIARLSERQLQDAVTHVGQPFAVFDGEARVVAYNQAFANLYRMRTVNTPLHRGVTFGELAEWQLRMGFYAGEPDDPSIELKTLLARYRSGREHTYHLRDGRWMMVVYRLLPGAGRVALWTDVTALKQAEGERRRLEAQLHHSQRLDALGTLAGGAAHEINNALVPVLALTKLVASHLPEDSRDRRNLETVLLGAERSRDLVKQILAFSRKEEQRRERVDVAAVLREALLLMRATVPRSINLEEEISATPPVVGDPNQLLQVIVNLVTNAAQAIGEAHGTITVGVGPAAQGEALRLWVADTGEGIDEATRARIFEPFFTTKPVGRGTGLGLSVVHGIIKDHGGRVEVDSTPGRGARFEVFLPMEPAQARAAQG
jgi:PAS domain S-box-containing protein